jgi:hypothetical protein
VALSAAPLRSFGFRRYRTDRGGGAEVTSQLPLDYICFLCLSAIDISSLSLLYILLETYLGGLKLVCPSRDSYNPG